MWSLSPHNAINIISLTLERCSEVITSTSFKAIYSSHIIIFFYSCWEEKQHKTQQSHHGTKDNGVDFRINCKMDKMEPSHAVLHTPVAPYAYERRFFLNFEIKQMHRTCLHMQTYKQTCTLSSAITKLEQGHFGISQYISIFLKM